MRALRLNLIAAIACCAAAWSAPASISAQGKIVVSIFVGIFQPAATAEGFVDAIDYKGLNESAADVRKLFDNKDWHPNKGFPGSNEHYVLSADPSKADIVMTIAARGVGSQAYGSRTTLSVYNGVAFANTVPNVANVRWVSAVLTVGDYRKEFTAWRSNTSAFSLGSWGDDAKYLAEGVVSWVLQNEQKILERQRVRH